MLRRCGGESEQITGPVSYIVRSAVTLVPELAFYFLAGNKSRIGLFYRVHIAVHPVYLALSLRSISLAAD